VQLLIVAFEGGDFTGRISEELDRLSGSDTIRVLDAVLVAKENDDTLRMVQGGEDATDHPLLLLLAGDEDVDTSHLDGASEAELVDAAASIPPGTAAAIVLIEHRWAAPLRDAVAATGGTTVAETWLSPQDLAAAGLS
jgi:uncharacterized membrane protein